MAEEASQPRLQGLNTRDDRIIPLKSVWIDIHIAGYVAEVSSTLIYYNEENDPIEVTFTFPVDDGSAVFRFEAEIQGRHIKAEIQEKEQAQQTYQDAVDHGKTAMLLKEDNSVRDIFSCMLGNLPPKCEATLVMKYVLDLPQEPDGKIRFTLPTVLNPRYSPESGVTTAEGATYVLPNRIPYDFKMAATIQGYYKIVSVTSETCMLDVKHENDRNIAKVSLREKFKFDHDLQFLIQYEKSYAPQVVLERGNLKAAGLLKEDILMVSFHPDLKPVNMATGGEYIFMIDRSGSMKGSKMQNAKEALLLFVKSLPADSYLNIVSFGTTFTPLFSKSKQYSQQTLQEAFKAVEEMDANMRGTEIYLALTEVFSMKHISKHARSVFILTDGQVSNTNAVIGLVGEQIKKPKVTRVYSLGIGDGASTTLVNGIARVGFGKADFVRRGERIQAKVMSLLKCSMQPAVTKLLLNWDLPPDVTPVRIPTEFPTAIPFGEKLTLFVILQRTVDSPSVGDISGSLTLIGEKCGYPVKYKMKFKSSEMKEISSSAPVHRLAIKTQIKYLEDSIEAHSDRQKIIDLSLHGNVMSKFTAFVAIDSEGKKVDGQAVQRQCPVAMENLERDERQKVDGNRVLMQKWRCMPRHSQNVSKCMPYPTLIPWISPPGSHCQQTKENSTHNSPSDDTMMLLITQQKIEGSWEVSSTLLHLLEVTSEVFNNINFSNDTEVVCTVVVLCWLRKNLFHRQQEWQMIEAKAIGWLTSKSLDNQVEDLIKETTSLLWPSLLVYHF